MSQELLVCEGLGKRFGAKDALTDVTMTLESGKIIGLLGPNGSGKTTLIKLANGLLMPDTGFIKIDGGAGRPHQIHYLLSARPDVLCRLDAGGRHGEDVRGFLQGFSQGDR